MTTPQYSSSGHPLHHSKQFRISCSLLADSVNLPPLLVIPEQVSTPQQIATGTRALMQAILESAIQDFQQRRAPTPQSRRLAQEAEEWLWSNATDWPFSFVNICDALGFNPSYLRTKLMLWQAEMQLEEKPSAA